MTTKERLEQLEATIAKQNKKIKKLKKAKKNKKKEYPTGIIIYTPTYKQKQAGIKFKVSLKHDYKTRYYTINDTKYTTNDGTNYRTGTLDEEYTPKTTKKNKKSKKNKTPISK